METSTSPSSSSIQLEDPSYEGAFEEQSLLFSDSLKDLKSLRSRLYSAAEYFELSYTNDDHKQIAANTLKDYTVKALVNTVDHLGTVSYKVNGYVNEKADEVSKMEIRVSYIEQRVRTCQDHVDHQGLAQQMLLMPTPKYYKRYVLPVGDPLPESGRRAVAEYQDARKSDEDFESKEFQNAVISTIASKMVSSRKLNSRSSSSSSQKILDSSSAQKMRFPSPSVLGGKSFQAEKRRVVSPLPSINPLMRSGPLSNGPAARSLSPIRRRHPLEPENSGKPRTFLKSLLSRRKSKNDEMLNAYLDEY